MQVWNVLHTTCWKYRTQKWRKNSPSAHHRTNFSFYIFTTEACINNRKKKLLNSNSFSTYPYNMVSFTPLAVEIGSEFGALQQISTAFASWLRYYSSVAHRRPTKFCTMFGHLLGWCTIYTFLQALAPWRSFASCKIYFVSKCCIFLFWQHYCTALEQWASSKLCRMVQWMELLNFRSSSFSTEGTTYILKAAITLGIGPHSSLNGFASWQHYCTALW